jgi:hypothetical protein
MIKSWLMQHTPNRITSFKSIDTIHNFPYNIIFLLYFIIFLHYSLKYYICGHIRQDFIITQYYIVFYHFNNNYFG